jgi:nucleotide-binding universal stress UspA family protein
MEGLSQKGSPFSLRLRVQQIRLADKVTEPVGVENTRGFPTILKVLSYQQKGFIMFKNILVPTDGSDFSLAAARNAVSFAKEAGARVTAFYAKPERIPYFAEGVQIDLPPIASDESADEQAKAFLGFVESLCREAGVNCAKVTKTSNVIYASIIETATENNCDLIFMASHGRRGIGALLLGSETNKVLTHSKIPVLVYR